MTDKVAILSWSTAPFEQPTEMIGTGAAHIFAEIDQPDTNFILRMWDAAPDGTRQLITTGYLKASHRELDERTTEGDPYHPHTRAVPVEPGRIEEYVLRLYPFAASFRPGHRLVPELSNDEPLVDDHNSLLPADAFHLPVGRPVTHKIYPDAAHPSGSSSRSRRRSGNEEAAPDAGELSSPIPCRASRPGASLGTGRAGAPRPPTSREVPMGRWTVNGLVRSATRSRTGRFALRVVRDLGNLQLVDRGMTIAAHVFTSIIPILIVAGALRSRLDPQSRPVFAEHLGLDEATAEILEKSLPNGAQELRATGVIGVILLVIAATSFARALERSLRIIWRTPAVSIKFAWRWLAAVAAVVIGLAFVVGTRIFVRGPGVIPLIEFLAEIALWGLLWWTASWIVVNGRIGLRQLLPGSVLAGVGFAVAGVFGRAFLPPLFSDSASRFGVLGVAFTYIGWLLALAITLLIAVTVGRVVYLTSHGIAWRRADSGGGHVSRNLSRTGSHPPSIR